MKKVAISFVRAASDTGTDSLELFGNAIDWVLLSNISAFFSDADDHRLFSRISHNATQCS